MPVSNQLLFRVVFLAAVRLLIFFSTDAMFFSIPSKFNPVEDKLVHISLKFWTAAAVLYCWIKHIRKFLRKLSPKMSKALRIWISISLPEVCAMT